MSTIDKILKSWWVILSAVMFLNGFGFIYIGLKNNNKNWVIEGIVYEIPWIFGVMFVYIKPVTQIFSILCIICLLVSIVRSVWVAIKLCDVYDNEEKYRVQTTVVNNTNIVSQNNDFPCGTACCVGIFLIFFALALFQII
ncbi:hypothetical protein [Methanobrevibacter sp.]